MPDLAKLKMLWIGGAVFLFVAAATLGVTWAVVSGCLGALAEMLGYSSEGASWWVAVTSPLWAPLQVGAMIKAMPRVLVDDRGGRAFAAPSSRGSNG